MPELTVQAMYILAGVILYAMFHHLAISRGGGSGRLHGLFALVCFFALVLAGIHAQTIRAQDITRYILDLKLEISAALLLIYALTGFIAYYTERLPRRLMLGLGSVYAVLIVANLSLPYSLQYDRFAGISQETLPWGEVISRPHGHTGLWTYLAVLVVALSFGYAFRCLFIDYRKTRESSKLWMLFAFGFMLSWAVEGIMVRLGFLGLPEAGPFGIVGMIVMMSAIYIRGTRQQLLASERNFHSLFDNSPTAMAAIDPQTGRMLEVNQIALDMIGYTRAEFLSRTLLELTVEDDEETTLHLLDRLTSGKTPLVRYEGQFKHKDGRRLLTDTYFSAMRDNTGKVVKLIASAIDITETRLAQRRIEHESEKNRALLRNASDGLHILDAEGHVIEASDSFCAMLGYTRDEVIGMHVSEWDDMMTGPEIRERMAGMFERHEHVTFETRHRRKDGAIFTVEITSVPLELEGQPVLFNSSRDITARKQAEDALRESETRFHTLFAMAPVGISFSRDGIMLGTNNAYKRMHGFSLEEDLKGRQALDFFAPGDRNALQARIARRAAGSEVESSYEAVGLRKDGTEFPKFISATRVQMADGPITFAYTIDFTELKQREKQIQKLAFYDQLTHLPNRQLMNDRLHQALSNAARGGRHGAVLLIDIDNFKTINDTIGHESGDVLLQQFAARLVENIGDGDTVARLGGDEFLVILENLSDVESEAVAQTETAGQKILHQFTHPFMLGDREFHCTSSLGATLFKDASLSMEELIKQADIAMYQAKKNGRNTARFFDPRMQDSVNHRARTESDLYKAIEKWQFELNYQQQVNYLGQPVGAEVLIRWHHPERGLIPPMDFIPLAEETGQILAIGQWVLDSACRQLRLWQEDAATRELGLAVNVSSLQFHEPDFIKQVKTSLQRHAVPPWLLKIELTESVLLENIERTISIMEELKRVGIQFSLDDFGTGYSSLQYLKMLPLDQLKIDKSFIQDIVDNPSDRSIVQTIIAMAHTLGLEVIAEGVETDEQRNLLFQIGCKTYQGYRFGRPLPIDECMALIQETQSTGKSRVSA